MRTNRIKTGSIPGDSFSEGYLTAVQQAKEWLVTNLPFMYGNKTANDSFVCLFIEHMEGAK